MAKKSDLQLDWDELTRNRVAVNIIRKHKDEDGVEEFYWMRGVCKFSVANAFWHVFVESGGIGETPCAQYFSLTAVEDYLHFLNDMQLSEEESLYSVFVSRYVEEALEAFMERENNR